MRFSRMIFILVCLITSIASISYASSGGKIAFMQSNGFNQLICITDEEGKDIQKLTDGSEPSWSSDGSMIAFVRGQEIYVMAVDSKLSKRLGCAGYYPLISPDRTKIAYYEVNWPEMWLDMVDINGENQRHLKKVNSIEGRPHTWSPDGKNIAFCDGNIYIINVDTLDCRKIICAELTEHWMIHVDWSPKGDKLAVASKKFIPNPLVNMPPSKEHGIWVMNLDGSNAKRLTRDNEYSPEWSPDGSKIAYVVTQNMANAKIYVMDADGKNIKRLTDSMDMSEYESDPSWYGSAAAMQPLGHLVTTWGNLKK